MEHALGDKIMAFYLGLSLNCCTAINRINIHFFRSKNSLNQANELQFCSLLNQRSSNFKTIQFCEVQWFHVKFVEKNNIVYNKIRAEIILCFTFKY